MNHFSPTIQRCIAMSAGRQSRDIYGVLADAAGGGRGNPALSSPLFSARARQIEGRGGTMIRNDAEYQAAIRCLEEDRDHGIRQKSALQEQGLTPEEVDRAMEPLTSHHAQLAEEVDWYKKVRERNFEPLSNLTQIGQLLIGLRIANGLSQKDLAERLAVSEAQVSRDERNEYHGITLERAQRVLDALGETLTSVIAGAGPARSAENPAGLVCKGGER